jgi:GNAT superfamily N-acetyltransferase
MAYPSDPSLRAAVLELFGSVWPWLPGAITLAGRWGADWYEASTPFVEREGARAVAHAGVVPVVFAAEGRELVAGGVHAVCTAPDRRGRGLMRRALERALAFADARYETVVLWTEEPALYVRHGFVARAELQFEAALARGSGRAGGGRALALDRTDDLALLRAALARRTPVSGLCAARDPGGHFLIDLAIQRAIDPRGPAIDHLPELGSVVVHRRRGAVWVLEDVVADVLPPLAALADRLAGDAAAVEVLFTPDRLDAPSLRAAPRPPPSTLMVRGRPLPDGPLALSPYIQT